MNFKKKIKVLHIITDLPIGGAQDNTLHTIEELDKTRYELTLICNSKGPLLERAKKIPEIKLINLKYLERDIRPVKDALAFIILIKILICNQYHIVHTHSSKPGVLGRLAAWIIGIPVIIHTVHGFPFHDQMNGSLKTILIAIERSMARISNHLITVSNLNLIKIINLNIAPRHKLTNIYSGIDFKKFANHNNNSLRIELSIPDSTKIIGSIGRLSLQKDPLCFIRAIPIVREAFPDSHFILVGSGELKEKITQAIKKLRLEDCVSLLGSRDDIPNILHSIDLFVLSSIYEGLGRSLTEAIYCKLPVVATNVEGVPELVQNNNTGCLVEPVDEIGLAHGIINQLKNPAKARLMAEKAFEFVKSNFDVHSMVTQIDQLYKEIILKP
ncbi:MAG: glycosyltransferase family 4 protein [Candidatus Marinimicrobia bacterium]|nr:glycosyltransferase family 4 protein [Candidatus Neomarinimicrobiota bacterium]